jgi:acetyltransferase-like isoleucine patch superfamily enzyme
VILSQGVKIDVGRRGRVVLGHRVWLGRDTELETENSIVIGDNTSIQRRCSINGEVKIGRDCIFAPNVFVSSGSHVFRAIPHLPIREQDALVCAEGLALDDGVNKPVWIQDDCWLGINVVVCPGVTIGKGSVVGANSVVTHNVRPYTIVAGSPAREIGARLDWSPPLIIDASNEKDRVYVLSGCKAYIHNETNFFEASLDNPFLAIVCAEVKSIKICFGIKSHIKVLVGSERNLVDVYNGVFELVSI